MELGDFGNSLSSLNATPLEAGISTLMQFIPFRAILTKRGK